MSWIPNIRGQFAIKSACDALKGEGQQVPWANLLYHNWWSGPEYKGCPLLLLHELENWFSKNVPRWAFILWLCCLGRLSTKDRLRQWKLDVDPLCIFRNSGVESHDHLFFECPFSSHMEYGLCSTDTSLEITYRHRTLFVHGHPPDMCPTLTF